jgi:hypothetical protein
MEVGTDQAPHLSFLLGAYGCPGKSLAQLNLRIALSTIVQNFDITFATDEISEAFDKEVLNTFTVILPFLPVLNCKGNISRHTPTFLGPPRINRSKLAIQLTPRIFKDGDISKTYHQLRYDALSALRRQHFHPILNVVLRSQSIYHAAWLVPSSSPPPRSDLAWEGFPGIFVNVYFTEDAEAEWNYSKPSEDVC